LKTGKLQVVVGLLLAALLLIGAVAGTAYATVANLPDATKAVIFQDFIAKLAANLGIEEDKLTAAIDTTRQQLLDEAVAQGKLTREQADRIAAKKDGNFCGFLGLGPARMVPGEKMGGRSLEGMASILGITPEELQAELESGKSMADIAGKHGLTLEQFQQKQQELRRAEIMQQLKEGKITQEQADKMLQGKGKGPHHERFQSCDDASE
jgi:polyhydroxyalkanoate synthesis regulator phasin